MSVLIVGCGYLGWRVARCWMDSGIETHAVTRSDDRAESMRSAGFRPHVADITQPASLSSLPAVDVVVYAVGYDRHSERSRHEVYVNGLRNVLDALPPSVERLIYLSSSGVFGQTDGSWVDEQSECRPAREGGRVCLAAERVLAVHDQGRKRIVLRLAGIYGPGRIPQLDRLSEGAEVTLPERGFLNLIHVDDAASIVFAAAARAHPPALYLVSDGHPVERRDFYCFAAQRHGLPPPRFRSDFTAETQASSRATSSKRIKNERMIHDLRVSLRYPSYRDGLLEMTRKL